MIEEIKTDNNCIVKAFENNPISILEENLDNKKIYYFKASDIGKVLNLSNIRVSIQNYDEDEQVVRKAYDLRGCEQDTIFLTSRGVYRLLYSSKKEIAKKFRKWASDILDDIIFNQSKELKCQLEEKEKLLLEKNKELEKYKEKVYEKVEKRGFVYVIKTGIDGPYKIGKTKDIVIKRVKGLQTGNVNNIQILLEFPTSNPDLLERTIHYILDRYRCNSNREFFDCDFEYIQKIVTVCGSTIDTLKSTYQSIISTDEISILDNIYKNIDDFSSNLKKYSKNRQLLDDEQNEFYRWLDKNIFLQKCGVLRLKDVTGSYINGYVHPKAAKTLRLELETYIKNKYPSIKSEYTDSSFNGMRYKGWRGIILKIE